MFGLCRFVRLSDFSNFVFAPGSPSAHATFRVLRSSVRPTGDSAMPSAHDPKSAPPAPVPSPAKPDQKPLPRCRVLLHNDDVNTQHHVTQTLASLTPLNWDEARVRMIEAHFKGVSLLLISHRERAELYQDQLQSKGLTVTVEPE
jgi:ATP-dependent Clp protease adaptor protein ClpS